MTSIPESLFAALKYRQAGRLDEAEGLYRQILAADPHNAVAINDLGNVFADRGMIDEACRYYELAANENPGLAQAHFNLGAVHYLRGSWDAAQASYEKAIELKPDYAFAHNNLGVVFQGQRQKDRAASCYRRALTINPAYSDAHNNLGTLLFESERIDEAIASYRRALELNPTNPEAYNNLGKILGRNGQFDDAIAAFREALRLKDDYAEVHAQLGQLLYRLCRSDEALVHFGRAAELQPSNPEWYTNLGECLEMLGHFAEAAKCYQQALHLDNAIVWAHTNHATLALRSGNYQEGWSEYEWRRSTGQLPAADIDERVWTGGSLVGRTILIRDEQGLGDTIQFIRYAKLVKDQGARVVVECQNALLKLLACCRDIDQLVPRGDELPDFDAQVWLLSLPRIFGTTLDSIPASVPYLYPDTKLVKFWRDKLSHLSGYRIGIHWRGKAGVGAFRRRDIPLEKFGELADLQGVELISLQKGEGPQELALKSDKIRITNLGTIDEEHGAFMDTAAIMKNLDLVITCDTSIAHLAGAIGATVWVALPFVADWRWLLDRSDSPWYPTMLLFRQKHAGDWAGVFTEIRTELGRILVSGGGAAR